MKVTIKRQLDEESKPYYDTFIYDKEEKVTVAAVLDYLNYNDDLVDIDGNEARRIMWECSCMQKMCGACAMVINNEPALACSTFVDPKETKELLIEPLTKFPVICDLLVDRSYIMEFLEEAEVYLGELDEANMDEHKVQYNVAKCLKCGLCLEVCPNFSIGGDFGGAVLANEIYLYHTVTKDRKKELKKSYKKHFEKGCSKSLACRDICPMKIPTLSSIDMYPFYWTNPVKGVFV